MSRDYCDQQQQLIRRYNPTLNACVELPSLEGTTVNISYHIPSSPINYTVGLNTCQISLWNLSLPNKTMGLHSMSEKHYPL